MANSNASAFNHTICLLNPMVKKGYNKQYRTADKITHEEYLGYVRKCAYPKKANMTTHIIAITYPGGSKGLNDTLSFESFTFQPFMYIYTFSAHAKTTGIKTCAATYVIILFIPAINTYKRFIKSIK